MTEPSDDDPALAAAPPGRDQWSAVGDDVFARIVPHVRRGLATLDDLAVTPEVRRLQAVPASKLGRGRTRARVAAVLAEGGPAWVAVRERLLADPDVAGALAAALAGTDGTSQAGESPQDGQLVSAERHADVVRARDDQRAQRDRARAERDAANRRAAGAEGREDALRGEVAGLQSRIDDLESEAASLRDDLADVDERVASAVARAQRRGETQRAELTADLAAARREVDGLRRARARHDEVARVDTGPARAARPRTARSTRPTSPGPDLVVAGRPSRLPVGLRLDTRDGAGQLLDAVGEVLVDGYNVTRTHRGDLDLAGQRNWLVRGLEALAARRRLEATVVFDAHLDGVGDGHARTRGRVGVQWSHPGVTADDEIVFAVEARDRDRPLVVVTDDRGLRDRLAASRVDLLHTAPLSWLLG